MSKRKEMSEAEDDEQRQEQLRGLLITFAGKMIPFLTAPVRM